LPVPGSFFALGLRHVACAVVGQIPAANEETIKMKPVTKKPSKAAKPVARMQTAKPARAKPIPLKTATAQEATNQDMLAGLVELVRITSDMRELLTEIRDLLAEGMEEEEEAEEEPEEGVGTLIIAETGGGEDLE